jgi:hypothetical protein
MSQCIQVTVQRFACVADVEMGLDIWLAIAS